LSQRCSLHGYQCFSFFPPGRSVRCSVPGALRVPVFHPSAVPDGGGNPDVAVRGPAIGQSRVGHDRAVGESALEVDLEIHLPDDSHCEFVFVCVCVKVKVILKYFYSFSADDPYSGSPV
jgi:hypothetical protein